jgi:hypothetical protein
MAEIAEPTAADRASSDACTRSGAFALLLSVVLLLLIPYWLDRPKRKALGEYLTNRLNLIIYLEKLDDDPVWQMYKDSHPTAESTSIAQLNCGSERTGYCRRKAESGYIGWSDLTQAPTRRRCSRAGNA